MIFRTIRKKNPLIHCITNYVVANFQANGLLAIGASPVMADDSHEVEEMVTIASGLLINIGTLNEHMKESMLLAGKKANALGIPIILDPVAAGATTYRKQTVRQLLKEIKFAAIRCNIGELAAIANVDWQQKGVDSGHGSISLEIEAKQIAQLNNCIVIVTGEKDFITDGEHQQWITGGNPQMTEVTGTGCLLSAICCAAYATGNKPFTQLVDTLSLYKKVAEQAASSTQYIGDFQIAVLNELHRLSKDGVE
ncbi:hydroxyethylthiazole kinase [Lysinibacillus agricola]|uniref:Hydroxyethylthiazole kinase n=1 Tax=Lysinibacillus agricola TaxID=2590012 RepID=A0ABX7AP93_9BACI|nr:MULTISPECIES: hydroxyethylthiazole kinase [Lysinibacillus]KOS64756.1 hydroxyethylthiazole kinase [Lysinibacillus sp. FJAT-14222]QQP11775.1 hydroxyethylthiazole kinase [Lysinibacillus agricola]